MSYQHSSFDCTSANFEKAALSHFRTLVAFLPDNCRIYRQTWEFSTVLCLDFLDCVQGLAITRQNFAHLVNVTQELGLGQAIILKVGNKIVEWHRLTV
ncbi:MAG: hypothetical protein EWV50_06680 [Microcystis aeruginosa Ma_MB_F_20061100_S20]|uniref:Uncharacterized protein n=1 Tax=Microcystis aeruginosa Ma_MB_F_20061100_S20D TaxID=2486253 RepID=A0A552E9C3_MICAE|nr:MAG: hypothetical protein EWV78_21475 [Microcystis aeruginosa Ma_MB_F_20061100_S20D]TRU41196.1 MAG: hypothetical protein EWV50_06680 [Microcystis aeruginosa Ma_MB_F_20061100_S20]